MKLPLARVEELASRPGVNRTAVENFLGTLDDMTRAEALANLEVDAKSYRWNTATGRAIQQGIMEAAAPQTNFHPTCKHIVKETGFYCGNTMPCPHHPHHP